MEFCLVQADRKDWDQCPKGIPGQEEVKGTGELGETGETVHKAKHVREPAVSIEEEVGRRGIS